MIEFKSLDLSHKAEYDALLCCGPERGCEYNFANLYLWGRQKMAFLGKNVVFFSQFNRKSVYLFPIGCENGKDALDAVIHDAQTRGIPCRLTGLTQDDCAALERLYPGKFRYHFDRDSFDYIYDINDLAELKGRKYQRKRNHLNRFLQARPDYELVPITDENTPQLEAFLEQWYANREEADPHADFHMEKAAIKKALQHRQALDMEGLLLMDGGQILAMTMGSPLKQDTFDIHFEKALDIADGAYPAINWSFARYLRDKYPQLRWLNREEDMGLEGLRKAKLSYCPDHMVEKSWACLLEDGYDY